MKQTKRRAGPPMRPGSLQTATPVGMRARSIPPAEPTWFHHALLMLTFILLALLATRQIASPDAGFHLKAGEHILSGRGWPRNDPFTFTMTEHAYTDMSWGYQVMVALVHRAAGATALVIFHTLLVLATFFLLYRTARLAPTDPTTLCLILLVAGLSCEMRFEMRPELLSYVFLACLLYLLSRYALGLRSPLWALPILHLLWANAHSLFILGWIAMACFLLHMGLAKRRLDRPLLFWSLTSVLVAFVNPYGWRGVTFPLTLLTRFEEQNVFAQSIGELVSPFSMAISQQFPFYPRVPVLAFRTFALLSVLALWNLARMKRLWCIFLWIAFAPLAVRMVRNMSLLSVVALPGTVWALPAEGLIARLGLRRRAIRTVRSAVLAAAAVAVALIGLRVVHDAYYVASRREDRFGWGWNRLALPIEAAEYADQVGLSGPFLNHLNFGGYLMWARTDPVFIDGRLEVVGESFFQDYQRALGSEQGIEACVARYGIRWTVFPYAGYPDLLGRVSRDSRWRLAHVDPLAAVFVRRGCEPPGFVEPASEAPKEIRTETIPGLGRLPRCRAWAHWSAGLWRRERFPSRDHYLGLFDLYRGEANRAGAHIAQAVRESGGAYYELYNNLGAALFRMGRLDDALRCYRVVIEMAPRQKTALQRIAEIERRLAGGSRPPG